MPDLDINLLTNRVRRNDGLSSQKTIGMRRREGVFSGETLTDLNLH